MSWRLWEVNPALLYSLALLCGLLFALSSPWALLPFVVLCATALPKVFSLTLLFLLPLPWTQALPPKNEGHFHIQHIHYQHGWAYRGTLNLRPVTIYTKTYHPAHHDYYVSGTWKTPTHFQATSWKPLHTPSLAKLRYDFHQRVSTWLYTHFNYPDSAQFMIGMLTGETECSELKKQCQAAGLSHLLAVSGFHFAVLYFFFEKLFSWFLPATPKRILLLFLMTAYALMVGHCPSALRAWMFMTIYLVGELIDRKSSALNTLGASMLLSLLFQPFSCLSLSFQLSFLATAGIILFYFRINRLLYALVPRLKFYYVATKRPMWWGCGYMLCGMFRDLLALTLSVHVTTLPLMLFYFHLFYPHSLFYNLFFPFLASLSLFLLPLFPVCDLYTHLILKIVYSPPLLTPPLIVTMPVGWMTGLLTVFGLIGLSMKEKNVA